MFTKIFGILWVLLGVLWSLKPGVLRNRMKNKMSRKMKWVVLGFIVVMGFTLLGSVVKAKVLYFKIIGLIGLIIVMRGIFLVTAKTSGKISGWLEERSLLFFRAWAIFVLGVGIMLLLA